MEDHYVLSIPSSIDEKLEESPPRAGVSNLMQGGHIRKLAFEWYLDLLATHPRKNIRTSNIQRVSPPEFQHFRGN